MTRGWKDPITGVPVLSSAGTVWDIAADGIRPALDHVVCCEPTRALCGADVKDEPLQFSADPAATAQNPCQKCFNLAADNARCRVPMCPGNERPD